MGARRRRDLCSDVDCRVVRDEGLLVCPRCQADIRGEIDSEVEPSKPSSGLPGPTRRGNSRSSYQS